MDSFTLAANVEHLQATSTGEFFFEGNALGNEMRVTIADLGEIYGYRGDDVIDIAGAVQDEVMADGGEGNDYISAAVTGADIYLHGDAGDDHLINSEAGGDVYLDGGVGADIMVSSATGMSAQFHVDDENDVVIASEVSGSVGNWINLEAASYVVPENITDVALVAAGGQSVTAGGDDTTFRDINACDSVAGGAGDDNYVWSKRARRSPKRSTAGTTV